MTAGAPPGLREVLAEWGRIGCLGFGGPPVHIRMLRALVVERRAWMSAREFEDALAACNLLPGPASTQLAIFCAWHVRRAAGALVGGLAFILPGLVAILLLAAAFQQAAPPRWLAAAGAGAGAAVAAVAVQAGWTLLGSSRGTRAGAARARWVAYVLAGAVATVLVGAWVVLVLVACGAAEVLVRQGVPRGSRALPLLAAASVPAVTLGGLAAVAWTAFKVGALSYGGGFVIIPLMQDDAVDRGWMTETSFLNAVALGQVTPGPVVLTVAAVGYAAAGLTGGLLAAAVAFGPSFALVLAGAPRFDRLRADPRVRGFLDGAGPAAVGAILGSAVPLALALAEAWQWGVLAGAAVVLLVLRRGPVLALLLAALAGVGAAALGAPVPV